MDIAIDWLNLLVRWLHVIAGVAWIGASFYFVYLNNHLRPPVDEEQKKKGIDGELWAIHGGGFYFIERYAVAPEKIPKGLHWFKWEAYTTWISGFALLVLVYYMDTSYLIDPAVMQLTHWQAVLIGLGTLIAGYTIYDLMCRSPLGKHDLWFGIVGFAIATGFAYGLTQVFNSRGAYIHVGAMLGTIMAANVFMNIIPNQREVVAAMKEGRTPDAEKAKRAKQRSLHNNYITLPVLFIMISNHYPFTYGHAYNWAILAAISIIGAIVRHWFNLRGQGHRNLYIWPIAAVAMIALVFVTAPPKEEAGEKVSFSQAREIIQKHCVSCHSKAPTDKVWKVAPLGAMYDTPEQIKAMASKIKARAVDSKTMPLANKTGMTDEERKTLGRWISQGADITN